MKTVKEIDFSGKKVLIRVDFNVPVRDGKVADDTRIAAHMPTIKYVLDHGAAGVILISHLGRPKGEVKPEFSLKVVCGELEKNLGKNVKFLNDCVGDEVKASASSLKGGEVMLLENLRFHREEKKNNEGFAKELASLANVFVQDAFAVSHRAHASTVGLPKQLPSAAGFLIEKEVKFLSDLLTNPARPFVAVLGGAKISTKIDALTNLLPKVDSLLVGGAMSYTFLKARGEGIGSSLFEEEFVEKVKEIPGETGKLQLPADHLISKSVEKAVDSTISSEIPDGFYGVDIGSETIAHYGEVLKGAKTIFWNGPMGIFEVESFSNGTKEMAKIIAGATRAGAVSVAGGGDSVSAIKEAGVAPDFSHISTGGGASLEFIEGRVLPGIEVLK